MAQLLEDRRIDVLMHALNERYGSTHRIRERAQTIAVWAMGLSILASTWLLQSKTQLSHLEKGILLLGIAISYWAVAINYLGDLERGFKGQQRAAAKIELALGLYDVGKLSDLEEAIYPEAWKLVGTPEGRGEFFAATFTLLTVSFVFLVVSVLACGFFSN